MQVTYLVLAHHRPQQLAALLDLLLVVDDRVLVHVDAKADEQPFRRAVAHHGSRVAFTSRRHDVRWGGFGAVAAALTALRDATRTRPTDYYALISGADLPIKPSAALHAELASGAVYMNCWELPCEERGKTLDRLERFHVAARDRDSRVARRVNERLLPLLPKRDVERGLGGARPYAGSQWWLVPHDCAVQVLDFADRSPRFVRFFRFSAVPDESFFQTVVKALPQPWEVRPNLTYTDWSRGDGGGVSPATLTTADLPTLAAAPQFFARKFDLGRDAEVFARIRDELLTGA
ncbi:beta-1,6-N-acetylglucosaminyltransferase [Kineococcus auxinigenes]|uniref:beta-1,6-N-acetylglucosaminyltransferase n=1 Tax=unclassified Kineococcus TaxID=2621656 RepID=UPI003D7E6770